MKVHFTSQKEREPSVDNGLQVIYAPGKRVAYKLRWYLILLLVASPVLWFAAKLVGSILLIEAPARTVQPVLGIRAMEAGRIERLHVREGDTVTLGTTLITLDNPTLRAQHQIISAPPLNVSTSPAITLQFEAYSDQLERARGRVSELERLIGVGAATRGELTQAQDRLSELQSAFAALRYSYEPSPAQQAQENIRLGKISSLESRLDKLVISADVDATVQNLAVQPGEDVAPGSLLMELITDSEPEFHVFLNAQQRALASQGQQLRLRLPNGQWLTARVMEEPKGVVRLPPDLRSPIARNELTLLVRVELLEPLPSAWRINNVPMTARFPNQLQRLLE